MPQPREIREIAMPDRHALAESRPRMLAEATGTPGRYRVRLIDPGWGTSGYYSPQVLAEAAAGRVFAAGTHMYADHARGDGSGVDMHGNRSVTDLWAVLATDGYLAEGGAIDADIQVFAPYQPLMAEMSGAIGLSIRGIGTGEMGEAEGREGLIITQIAEAKSVDFVSAAGRGGRILALAESALPAAVVSRAVATGVQEATANEIREQLQQALRDRYSGEKSWVWVRDFDGASVWFEHETPDAVAVWQSSYTTDDAGTVTVSDSRTEVRAETNYVPVKPAGQSTTTESQAAAPVTDPDVTAGTPPAALTESTEGGSPMGTQTVLGEAERLSQLLAESRTALAEANARADKAEQRAATAERRATLVEAQRGAEVKAREALAKSDLKEAAWSDVVARVCDSLELNEAGKVDDDKLATAIEAEVQAERTKVARLMEAYGVGTVAGLGGGAGTAEEFSEADFEAGLTDVFTSIGLTEADAKTAAKGR